MTQQKITEPTFNSFKIVDKKNTILITDENVFALHKKYFTGCKTIIIKAGEKYKTLETIENIILQLINYKADKSTILVGVGGGVVTDVTGYVASVYMRGINFGFVPTTLLAMVDASIGGKNGVNFGLYKNFVGIINQPNFIAIDIKFLQTLPHNEWQNGFAEIIKHACIKNAVMLTQLEQNDIAYYKKNNTALLKLIQQNIVIKTKIVTKDVNEKGERKLLNFGHTLAHALENNCNIEHGKAVSIGINFACLLSQKLIGFQHKSRIENVLQQYELPTSIEFDKNKIFETLQMDKKKNSNSINFILLQKIGKAVIHPIAAKEIFNML